MIIDSLIEKISVKKIPITANCQKNNYLCQRKYVNCCQNVTKPTLAKLLQPHQTEINNINHQKP
jgi:hypothetical protein